MRALVCRLLLPFGNCLMGAILLRLYFRGSRIRWVRSGGGSWIRHFYVQTAEGQRWHYTVAFDVLPAPLYFLLYAGKFARMGK